MHDALRKLWAFLWHELVKRVWSLVLRHPTAVATTMVLFLTGSIAASVFTEDASLYQHLLDGSLRRDTEPTGSAQKGVEALLATQMPACIKEDLAHAQIANEFTIAFKQVITAVNETSKKCLKDCVPSPDVDVAEPPEVHEPLVTDGLQNFLFFPARLIPHVRSVILTDKQPTNGDIVADPEIRRALVLSQAISPALDALLNAATFGSGPENAPNSTGACEGVTHQALLDSRPVQVYFIHEYGLNRIAGRQGDRLLSKGYYERQFPAATYFPGRPYYLSAISRTGADGPLVDATGPIGNFFHVSQPYFDLAGNGLVVTLARGFTDRVLGRGVICFDIGLKPVSEPAGGIPLDLLDSLGSVARNVDCRIPSNERRQPSCALAPTQMNRRSFRNPDSALQSQYLFKLTNLIASNRNSLSQVTGSLQVLDAHYVPRQDAESGWLAKGLSWVEHRTAFAVAFAEQLSGFEDSGSQMIVSMPTAPPSFAPQPNGEQIQSSTFAVFNIDLSGFRRRTVLTGMAAVTSFLCGLGIILFVWELDSRTSRDMADALRRISQIMTNSGIVFTWLDRNDRIVRASRAFLDGLGYPSLTRLQEAHPSMTFESLLAPESIPTYKRVEQLRAAGKPVAPYPLVFVRANGSHATFTVVSASVPSRKGLWTAIPETFGVLLEGNVQIEAEIA